MFQLTIVTYLLLWAYIGATWLVASRSWRADPYRVLGRGVLMLQAAAILWASLALLYHGTHRPNPDFLYESIGCFGAILSGFLGIVWCRRSFGPGPLMSVGGGGWLLMIFATLIASA